MRLPVYDSVSGKHLLIPQGSKIIGRYDNQLVYGQERVLVVWDRILFPDGRALALNAMPGSDISGYAGFNDKVDNRFGKMMLSTLVLSGLSAGAQLSQAPHQPPINYAPTLGQTLAQSLGNSLNQTGVRLLDKNINLAPTLLIRPGYLFNIMVVRDLVFKNTYSKHSN